MDTDVVVVQQEVVGDCEWTTPPAADPHVWSLLLDGPFEFFQSVDVALCVDCVTRLKDTNTGPSMSKNKVIMTFLELRQDSAFWGQGTLGGSTERTVA